MPSKDFGAHLREAGTPDQYLYLSEVQPGDFDGSISFTFLTPLTEESIKLVGIVSDTHDYPDNHNFVVLVVSDNEDPAVTKELENASNRGLFHGVTVHNLLTEVQGLLFTALHEDSNARREVDGHDSLSDDFEMPVYDSDWSAYPRVTSNSFRPVDMAKKIRSDLRLAKAAGYKIGHLGDTNGNVIISISCRISRLEISEDCLLAWHVNRADYFVLLIRYPRVYLSMQEAFEIGDTTSSWIQMRVGLCESYKPSLQAAVESFDGRDESDVLNTGGPSFRSCFISGPLEKLLNGRFLPIANLRRKFSFSWTSAELFFQHSQGKINQAQDADSSEYKRNDKWDTSVPALLMEDHFAQASLDPACACLPLVAMQFTLRHFVKCGDFCLVCHCKTFAKFESVKPYVCSNGLCLYQYISFGMGSSLEYAIRNQPMVVDLLVSLLYASASSDQLAEFPIGLGLKVPDCNRNPLREDSPSAFPYVAKTWDDHESHIGTLDPGSLLLTGVDIDMENLLPGTWFTFSMIDSQNSSTTVPWSCRISENNLLGQYTVLTEPMIWGPAPFRRILPVSHGKVPVKFVLHEAELDDLEPKARRSVIRMLLNSLPGVNHMRQYLMGSGSERYLSSWDRIDPAALDILRWVIASNRSSIMQDHQVPEHLVSGMKGFIQFRLAQGAPDKEHRFMQAIDTYSTPVNPQYPTIFAWHGSGIENWHSILSEGLHFKKVTNGRVSGNGVYFSSMCTRSLSYSRGLHESISWPGSTLNMSRIVSLNEVVNRPEMFQSSNPDFVVPHLDWIQPRYLFVGTHSMAHEETLSSLFGEKKMLRILRQEPRYEAKGPSGKTIEIPCSAISHRRRQAHYTTEIETVGQPKWWGLGSQAHQETGDDCESVATCHEDHMLLISDDEIPKPPPPKSPKRKPAAVLNKTTYKPGKLVGEQLPLFGSPEFASRSASQTLQRHLQAVLKTQSEEPLHELGWCVDPNLIHNMYQWIVELHSFDNDLPLAADLKQRNMQSIILEMRFPDDFPMNPPFVRVVRPRFLDFAHGGGGHVTAGGAMCMELLTNSGWSAVASIESVLLQVRMAICSTDPRPARLCLNGPTADYGISEAMAAYKRACLVHGWKVPPGLELMQNM